jgi:hypothetical protein
MAQTCRGFNATLGPDLSPRIPGGTVGLNRIIFCFAHDCSPAATMADEEVTPIMAPWQLAPQAV